MKSYRRHSRELKLQICHSVIESEKSLAQVCREHRLARSVVSRWVEEYKSKKGAAFSGSPSSSSDQASRVLELERTVVDLTLENRVLKDCLGKLGLPPGSVRR